MRTDDSELPNLDNIKEKDEIKELGNNRFVVKTVDNSEKSDVKISVTVTVDEETTTEEFFGDNPYQAFSKFGIWYASHVGDSNIMKALKD